MINEILGKLKPEKVVFVLSIDQNNKPSGMVAGWQTRCSANPPLFAVSLSKRGHTHQLIRQSKEFVLAFPNQEIEKEMLVFGTTHGNQVDKFMETGLETISAQKIRTPLIKKATFNFECQLTKEVDAGDHLIFIGEVVAAHQNPGKKLLFNLGTFEGKRKFGEL